VTAPFNAVDRMSDPYHGTGRPEDLIGA